MGPTYAERLHDAGIETPGDLAATTAETVTDLAEIAGSQAEERIVQAAEAAEESYLSDGTQPILGRIRALISIHSGFHYCAALRRG
ncbi:MULTISPECIES: helix-hairpin-helix domain-containing protein [Halococcus]|uniref:helix-hairpin-helix domain-containing protein n=1 Tax=Halococcus salifodinae TaxID=36738 RepID=UPI0023626632|nr:MULTISPECIES: helix-hairpin-helix domain-containing protein [Halococcus]